jgi:hypothetical protein
MLFFNIEDATALQFIKRIKFVNDHRAQMTSHNYDMIWDERPFLALCTAKPTNAIIGSSLWSQTLLVAQ